MPQIDEILANPATWSQYGPDVQAALANLSGNATQFPSRLSSSFQDPPGLSQSTIRGNGETAVAIDPQNRLSVLMDRQRPPQRQQQPLPKNYIKNNSTGLVIDMGKSANGGQDVWQSGGEIIDEFQNPDGTITRRMKVPTHDGFGRQSSIIKDMIVTPDYLNPLKAKEIEYAKRQAELLSGQGRAIGDLGFEIDPGAARGMMNEMMSTLQKNMGGDANAALSNMSGLIRPKSGGIGQDLLTKRYGKAPEGSRWSPNGQLEEIPGAAELKPLTEFQGKSLTFGLRSANSHEILNAVGQDGKMQPGYIKRALESTPFIGGGLGTLSNVTQSSAQQQVEQAQADFLNATLRQESGAAIADSEWVRGRQQYFPQPGDSKEVIAQKKRNRDLVIEGFVDEAGPAGRKITATREKTRNELTNPRTVVLPNGQVKTFPTPAAAAAFKQAAGL